MARQAAKPYTFVGTERELVDPQRYERALRAWSQYLLDSLAAERAAGRRPRGQAKVG